MNENEHRAGKPDEEAPNLEQSLPKAPAKPSGVRAWISRHKLLSFLVGFLLLWGAHYLITHPMDNPQPQKKVAVQGVFPYDRGLELRIEASYYSSNPICRETARAFFIFPQAEVSREAWRQIPLVREDGNRYRFDFYEDAIHPGFCDWKLRFVNYQIFEKGAEVQGGAILGFPGRYNVIRYECGKVISTYYKAPDRTPVKRVGIACLERDNHWHDPSRSVSQIDFVWDPIDFVWKGKQP